MYYNAKGLNSSSTGKSFKFENAMKTELEEMIGKEYKTNG